jgi:hypothetical protein
MDRPDVGLSGRQQALDEQIEKLNENLGQLWALELDGLWKMLDVVADSVREHGVPLDRLTGLSDGDCSYVATKAGVEDPRAKHEAPSDLRRPDAERGHWDFGVEQRDLRIQRRARALLCRPISRSRARPRARRERRHVARSSSSADSGSEGEDDEPGGARPHDLLVLWRGAGCLDRRRP